MPGPATADPLRILLLTLVISLAACGESSEQYIASARDALASGDRAAAIIELKNALGEDPDSAESRWLLGKLYLDTGDALSAEKELLRAQALDWNPDEVRPALARALLAQGRFEDVRALDYRKLSPTAAADLLAGRALAELAEGNVDEADRLVDLALDRDADAIDARRTRARILASQGDLPDALELVDSLLAATPGDAGSWSLKGDILLRQGQLEAAREALGQSITLSGTAYGDRFKRALISLQLQDVEAARTDAAQMLKSAPQHPAGNYVQGLLDFQEQKYDEAITALSLAEPAAEQYPLILFYLGAAHLVEGNRDQAAAFANRFYSLVPEDVNGRKLLAVIRLQQGRTRETQELLQPVLETHPDDIGALNIQANALLRDGQTDKGLDLLARIARLQPDSPVAQLRLGAGLLLSGQGEQAGEHLETALELDPQYQQADILLVMNHLREKDYDGAIEAAKAYQRRNLTSATPYNVLGRVYLAAGRPAEARDAFERALGLEPGNPSAHLSLAQMATAAGDATTARQHYAAILEKQPDNLPTLLQLAQLEARAQDEQAMVTWLERAMDAHREALEPRIMLARYYLGTGKPDRVAPLFADLDKLQKRVPQVLELTALAQLSAKQPADASLTLQQLLDASPDTAGYHYLLAMAQGGSGDVTQAKQQLARALELDQNHLPSLVALARIAAAENQPEAFARYLARAEALSPDAPNVLRLRALAANRQGDTGQAIDLTARALAAGPDTQTLLELAAYQTRAGRKDEARALLQQWVADHPADATARLALANDLQLAGDVRGASAQYQTLLESDPDNLVALNNLAWYLRQQNPKQALDYIRRAAELAPERPEVLDTLAVIEHINGDNPQAYRNIQRALAGAPGNPSMRYHRALIEAALDRKQEAIATLEELLGNDSEPFPEQQEAAQLLATLKG